MKKKILSINFLLVLVLFLFFEVCLSAQNLSPVNLHIRNIKQDSKNWCWAAVAQQIIYWNNGSAPYQCELVALASNKNLWYCCNSFGCDRPGHMEEIQGLIRYYGGRFSTIEQPTDPMTIYYTLKAGKAIILFLQTTPTVGHFIVVSGMEWRNSGNRVEPYFYINDPTDYFTRPVSFFKLQSLWRAAIVVQ